MKGTELTVVQQQAMEHIQRAHSQGKKLSEYARDEGVAVRQIYDAARQLRERGVLSGSKRQRASRQFVAVKVTPTMRGAVCRVTHAGLVIECMEWPAAAWLASLVTGPEDAA